MKNLRKPFLLLLFLSTLVSMGMAQSRFKKPLRDQTNVPTRFGDYHLGLKVGCPWNHLVKSDIRPIYLGRFGYEFGLSAERHFKSLSVGLDLLWASRGTWIMGQTTYQSSLHTFETIRYETAIAYDVFTLRAPLTWYLMPPNTQKVTPYVFVAPGLETSPGLLNLKAESLEAFFDTLIIPASVTYTEIHGADTNARSDNWAPPFLDLTVTAGTGVLVTLPTKAVPLSIKFDVGARVGLLNLASEALKKQGVRIHNVGLEAGLTLFIGIDPPLHDACYTFQRKKKLF
ncbi:MAG: hypothetical protein J5831_00395 [Bacteroidales bacterium]|nr:hypothetical protein [Bacteroidales bacterium]